jgi:hypothetical protein
MASSEQKVLLGQLTLTGKNREAFENCRAIPNNDRHCQALYLNANGAVRECMKQKGYIFSDLDFYADHKKTPTRSGTSLKAVNSRMGYAHGSNIRILSATITSGCTRLRTGGHSIETTAAAAR